MTECICIFIISSMLRKQEWDFVHKFCLIIYSKAAFVRCLLKRVRKMAVPGGDILNGKIQTIRLNGLCQRRIIMACTLFPEFICRSPLSGSFALLSLNKQWLLQTPSHHTVRQSQRTWALIQVHNIRRNLYQRTWTTKLFFHVQLLTWHMYDTLLDKTLLGQRLSRASIHAALQWSTPCPTAQKGRLLSTSPRR